VENQCDLILGFLGEHSLTGELKKGLKFNWQNSWRIRCILYWQTEVPKEANQKFKCGSTFCQKKHVRYWFQDLERIPWFKRDERLETFGFLPSSKGAVGKWTISDRRCSSLRYSRNWNTTIQQNIKSGANTHSVANAGWNFRKFEDERALDLIKMDFKFILPNLEEQIRETRLQK